MFKMLRSAYYEDKISGMEIDMILLKQQIRFKEGIIERQSEFIKKQKNEITTLKQVIKECCNKEV